MLSRLRFLLHGLQDRVQDDICIHAMPKVIRVVQAVAGEIDVSFSINKLLPCGSHISNNLAITGHL